MIDMGEPLHSADTAFVRAAPGEVVDALADPVAWVAWWRGVRTLDHKVTTGGLGVGDSWRVRALCGAAGLDVEAVCSDLRRRETGAGLWMDWRGHRDPCVGLALSRRPLEAEVEWYVRAWREWSLVSLFWRVRAEPPRDQRRLLAWLRQLGWRGLSGLKREMEAPR